MRLPVLFQNILLAASVFCLSNNARAQFPNAETKIWEIVKKQYPDDVRKQELAFEKQKDAFIALLTIKDPEVKRIAESRYIDDYVKQKEVYDAQLDAKTYMQTVKNKEAKERVTAAYPHDYVAQKEMYLKLTEK